MTPSRPLTRQDRPSNYPAPVGTRSLLIAFALVALVPFSLWALGNPVRAAALAVAVVAIVALARFADRARRAGGRTRFHLPGTDLNVEVAVFRPSRGR